MNEVFYQVVKIASRDNGHLGYREIYVDGEGFVNEEKVDATFEYTERNKCDFKDLDYAKSIMKRSLEEITEHDKIYCDIVLDKVVQTWETDDDDELYCENEEITTIEKIDLSKLLTF